MLTYQFANSNRNQYIEILAMLVKQTRYMPWIYSGFDNTCAVMVFREKANQNYHIGKNSKQSLIKVCQTICLRVSLKSTNPMLVYKYGIAGCRTLYSRPSFRLSTAPSHPHPPSPGYYSCHLWWGKRKAP